MEKKREPKKDDGTFLWDTRLVTDSFNVYEVAEEMDKAKEAEKKGKGKC